MDQVNGVTAYFIRHRKAAQMLVSLQKESGVLNNRLARLKYRVPTRWHSRLAAMVTYMKHADFI